MYNNTVVYMLYCWSVQCTQRQIHVTWAIASPTYVFNHLAIDSAFYPGDSSRTKTAIVNQRFNDDIFSFFLRQQYKMDWPWYFRVVRHLCGTLSFLFKGSARLVLEGVRLIRHYPQIIMIYSSPTAVSGTLLYTLEMCCIRFETLCCVSRCSMSQMS